MEDFLSARQKSRLVRRAAPFTIKNGVMYMMGHDNQLRQCLSTIEAQKVMELHEEAIRKHFAT
jgi:hypothetical protein